MRQLYTENRKSSLKNATSFVVQTRNFHSKTDLKQQHSVRCNRLKKFQSLNIYKSGWKYS